MLPDNQSVSDLLGNTPEAVLAWVYLHLSAIDCNQDWQDLAYGCSLEATISSDLSDDELVQWATAAVLLYDCLGEICNKPSERYRFLASGMALRASVINDLGPEVGHPVRDPAILEGWFFRSLDMAFEESAVMARNSISLPTDELLRLSRLKDRLRLMKCVQPQQLFSRTDELNRWYELLDISPEEAT
jgi:hypothetical protein